MPFMSKARLEKAKQKAVEEAAADFIHSSEDKGEQFDANAELNNKALMQMVNEWNKDSTSIVDIIRESEYKKHLNDKEGFFKKAVEAISDVVTSVLDDISFDDARLYRIQKRAAQMSREDVLIRSLIQLVRRYTIGRGVVLSTGNEEVDEFLKLFWSKDGADMESRQKEITHHSYLLGEYFLIYFFGEGSKELPGGAKLPNIELRKFNPWELKKVITAKDDDEKFLGVRRESPDRKVLNYASIKYYLDGTEAGEDLSDPVENAYVQFVKIGDGFGVRGFPQVFPILKWAVVIRELVYDIASKFHEWARVLYTLTLKSNKALSTVANKTAPKAGTVVVSTPEAAWDVLSSALDATGVEAVWQMLMYYFAGGAGIPFQLLIHDYSNANYSSSREARAPMNKLIGDHQDTLEEEFKIVSRVAIKKAVEEKILPATVKVPQILEGKMPSVAKTIAGLIKDSTNVQEREKLIQEVIEENVEMVTVDTAALVIAVDFPKVDTDSELNQAKVLKTYQEIGADEKTLLERAGFDYNTIVANKLAVLDANLEYRKKADQLGQQGELVVNDDMAGGADDPPDNEGGEE